MPAITVDALRKTYKRKKETVEAVKSLSFDVEEGALFGIIGPDGAGKTSLFRMLTTLLLPDGGTAWVDGSNIVKDFEAIRRKIGYMPGRFSLYQDLTVEENLEFFATIFHTTVRENYALVRDIYEQIEPFKKRKAGKLSGGMKQKLALSCALIHRPVVLFLDEPTTGVDAVSRKEFWEILKRLKHEGITILVSTPYMDEAALCDTVALLQNGEILSSGKPTDITGTFPFPLWSVRSDNMYQLLQDLTAHKDLRDSYAFGEYHHVIAPTLKKEELYSYLLNKRHENIRILDVAPNIEDCFMQLMKN